MNDSPSTETQALYATFSTETLKQLQRGFELDRAKGDPTGFCAGRLALIERILATRAAAPSPDL